MFLVLWFLGVVFYVSALISLDLKYFCVRSLILSGFGVLLGGFTDILVLLCGFTDIFCFEILLCGFTDVL